MLLICNDFKVKVKRKILGHLKTHTGDKIILKIRNWSQKLKTYYSYGRELWLGGSVWKALGGWEYYFVISGDYHKK